MAGASGNADIETGADALLSFLEEKTKWPVSKIADDLGVTEATVKRWAQALEKEGYVNIKYSAIRGMVLEYASDKSYDELNAGRSQLSLEAEEVEIEVDEVEEVTEDGSVKSNESVEDTDMNMESVGEIQTDEGANFSSQNQSQNSSKARSNSVGNQSSAAGNTPNSPKEGSEGKERLRDELEDKRKKEQKPGKATLKADKAKIKHSEEDHRDLTDLQQKVSSRSDGTAEEVETGEGLQQIIQNIHDDSDQLLQEDADKGRVYSELEAEMEALKNEIMEKSVDDRMKKQIFDTLDMVERNIEKSEKTGLIDRIKGFLSLSD